MSGFVLGVDGGGTRTRAVVVDFEGRELGRGEARGAVVTVDDPEAAANAVWRAVERALAAAGRTPPAPLLWAGLSGAGRPEARAAVQDALERTRVAEHVVVGTDVEAAFHHALGLDPGIMLIAGTGSIAWARRADGSMARVGGWGQHVGDEGGGYRIGADAVRGVVRAEDGRDAATALREPVLAHAGTDGPQGLVGWIATASKWEVAALVPAVVAAAESGDAAASGVLAQAVDELARHLAAIRDRAGPWPEPPPVVLWGGLIFEGGPLHGPVVRAVAELGLPLLRKPLDPPLGAALLALEALGG